MQRWVSLAGKSSVDEALNKVHSFANSSRNRFAQAHKPLVATKRGRFASDQHDPARHRTHGLRQAKNVIRIHGVPVPSDGSGGFGLFRELRRDDIDCAGFLAARTGIDQYDQLVGFEQCVTKVITTNSEIADADSLREFFLREPLRHFHSETVVAEKDVADTRYENFWMFRDACAGVCRRCARLDLLRLKEKTVARLPEHAEVFTGILLKHDRNMHLAFIILLDGLHGCSLSCQGQIKYVTPGAGAQHDPVPFPD